MEKWQLESDISEIEWLFILTVPISDCFCIKYLHANLFISRRIEIFWLKMYTNAPTLYTWTTATEVKSLQNLKNILYLVMFFSQKIQK